MPSDDIGETTPSKNWISLSDLAFAMEFDGDALLQAAPRLPAESANRAPSPCCKGKSETDPSIDYFREALQGIDFDFRRVRSSDDDVMSFDKGLLNDEAPASAAWESLFAAPCQRGNVYHFRPAAGPAQSMRYPTLNMDGNGAPAERPCAGGTRLCRESACAKQGRS